MGEAPVQDSPDVSGEQHASFGQGPHMYCEFRRPLHHLGYALVVGPPRIDMGVVEDASTSTRTSGSIRTVAG